MPPSPSSASSRPASPSPLEPTVCFPSSSETSNTFDPFAYHSLDYGVNVPHNIGPCLYMSDLPKRPCGPYRWDNSLGFGSTKCLWSSLVNQFHGLTRLEHFAPTRFRVPNRTGGLRSGGQFHGASWLVGRDYRG